MSILGFFVGKFFDFLLSVIPQFQIERFDLGGSGYTMFFQCCSFARNFIPIDTCVHIFVCGVGVTFCRFAMAIVLRVKSFIPFLGGT